jgi:hypothetical protein
MSSIAVLIKTGAKKGDVEDSTFKKADNDVFTNEDSFELDDALEVDTISGEFRLN